MNNTCSLFGGDIISRQHRLHGHSLYHAVGECKDSISKGARRNGYLTFKTVDATSFGNGFGKRIGNNKPLIDAGEAPSSTDVTLQMP